MEFDDCTSWECSSFLLAEKEELWQDLQLSINLEITNVMFGGMKLKVRV